MKDVQQGKIGNRAKYWLMYLDLMSLQNEIYTAVQTTDFDMRLDAWDIMPPYHFAFKKTHYGGYGTWYVQTMKEIDHSYSGLKELLKSIGLSVQSQTRYPIGTSIGQRGKQSIDRDAKTPSNFVVFLFYYHVPSFNPVMYFFILKFYQLFISPVLSQIDHVFKKVFLVSMVELILEILAGYGVPEKYTIFSNYDYIYM